MTVIPFSKFGRVKDDVYQALQPAHIDYCVGDLVRLFTVVAVNTPKGIDNHTRFARQLMHLRQMERNYMPSETVNMDHLMIFAGAGSFNFADKAIQQSLHSPTIDDSNPEQARTLSKNFILGDTSRAIAMVMETIFQDPEELSGIASVGLASDVMLIQQIRSFLKSDYQAPSNGDLNHAISECWLGLGIHPTQHAPIQSAQQYLNIQP